MDEYLQKGNSTVRPDLATFNTVLLALSRSDQQDAAIRIDALMQRMEEMATRGILVFWIDTKYSPRRLWASESSLAWIRFPVQCQSDELRLLPFRPFPLFAPKERQ